MHVSLCQAAFDGLNKWIKKITDHAENHGCQICLVGTKLDLCEAQGRAVSKEEIESLAATHKADFFETSAKDDTGVRDVFQCVAEKFNRAAPPDPAWREGGVVPGAQRREPGGCPCG